MIYLLFGLAPLLFSPLMFYFLRSRTQLLQFMDGLILTSVVGLFAFEIFPELMEKQGWGVLIPLLVGFLGPFLIEKLSHKIEKSTHTIMLGIIILGLVFHEALDGAVLAPAVRGHSAHGAELAWAVLLHRVPGALFIWWFFRPRLGLKGALGLIVVLGLATILGYSFGESIDAYLSQSWSGLIQAFVGGSILHVVFHGTAALGHSHHNHEHHSHHLQKSPSDKALTPSNKHGHEIENSETSLSKTSYSSQEKDNRATESPQHIHSASCHSTQNSWFKRTIQSYPHLLHTLGCLVGLGLIVWGAEAFSHLHGSHEQGSEHGQTWQIFLDFWWESSPALILGYLMSGVLAVFAHKSPIHWMNKGSLFVQSLKGVIVGLPLPICSCGVVPIYTNLVKMGAKPAAAFAFLLATPELGIDSIFLSYTLLGGQIALIRVLVAFILALLMGVCMALIVKYLFKFLPQADQNTLSNATPITQTHSILSANSPSLGGDELTTGDPTFITKETHHKVSNKPEPNGRNNNLSSFLTEFSKKTQFKKIYKEGFEEVFDKTMPWILFGILVASVIQPFLNLHSTLGTSPFLSVVLAAFLSLPLYVCASGSTPLAAALLAGGLSPGAVMAFLIAGPATNITTYFVLSRIHNRKLALMFSGLVFIFTIVLGWLVNLLPLAWLAPAQSASHQAVSWQGPFAILLGGLLVFALIRRGARNFMSEVGRFT